MVLPVACRDTKPSTYIPFTKLSSRYLRPASPSLIVTVTETVFPAGTVMLPLTALPSASSVIVLSDRMYAFSATVFLSDASVSVMTQTCGSYVSALPERLLTRKENVYTPVFSLSSYSSILVLSRILPSLSRTVM